MNCIWCKGKCEKGKPLRSLPCGHCVCQAFLDALIKKPDCHRKCPRCPSTFKRKELKKLRTVRWGPKKRGNIVGGIMTKEEWEAALEGPARPAPQPEPKGKPKASGKASSQPNPTLGKRPKRKYTASDEESDAPKVRLPPPHPIAKKTASRVTNPTGPKAARSTGMIDVGSCMENAGPSLNMARRTSVASPPTSPRQQQVISPLRLKTSSKDAATQTALSSMMEGGSINGVIHIHPGATVPVINFHTSKPN